MRMVVQGKAKHPQTTSLTNGFLRAADMNQKAIGIIVNY